MTSNTAINEPIYRKIQSELERIEREQSVKILFAVASGSRAWGFASPDSDYDARFVFKRQTRDYVRLNARRDVIELPITDDLDINGWDIIKALTQFRKSNPSLLEWLSSPIVYQTHGNFANRLRELSQSHFSPRHMTYHYVSMAKQNYRLSIENKADVSLKKYLYVLRPLACIAWLEQNDSLPPTSIHATLAGITMPTDVRARLQDLMQRKQGVGEIGTEAHDATLDSFIDSELARTAECVTKLPDKDMDAGLLDEILWAELGI